MISIKPKAGTQKVILDISHSVDGLRRGIRNGLFEIGRSHVKNTRNLMSHGAKTGRIYNTRRGPHQASAPNESPAVDTGELLASVDYSVRGSSEMEFGDKIFYGKYLEEGTRRMQARPHLLRTVEEQRAHTRRTLQRFVNKEILRRETR